ncbi:hypothetical protein ACIBBE_45635 [Streptomyces sp. NPDC051644]|uniref:hypothetical protein n=1 Tax=Streptomyces sp. NPDC051644 TaxID=3365666 RepID=UPI0037BD81D7
MPSGPRRPAQDHPLHHLHETLRQQLEATSPGDQIARLAEFGFYDWEIGQVLHRELSVVDRARTSHELDPRATDDLTTFLATCEAIAALSNVPSVVAWFRTPLVPAYRYTPLDLADKGEGIELDYAARFCTATQALAWLETWWRKMTGFA